MKRRLYEILIDRFKVTFPQYKKEVFERERQTENVITWIVGLSTGVITVIFSQFDKIGLIIPMVSLKYAVFLFVLTIISGVIFRIVYYELEQLEGDIILEFENYCAASTTDFSSPRLITEWNTIEDIINYLKEDMGVDIDYNSLINRNLNREFWVDLYNKEYANWEKTGKEGLANLGKAMAPVIGISSEDGEKLYDSPASNQKKHIEARKYRFYNILFYSSTLILFLIAIEILGFGFISNVSV